MPALLLLRWRALIKFRDYVDMIGEKWLSDVIFTTVQSKADISKVGKSNSGDFMQSELSQCRKHERN